MSACCNSGTGSLWIGMSGPGAALRLDIPDPVDLTTGETVDIMSAVSRSLVTRWHFSDGEIKALGPWSLAALSPNLVRAIYVPAATDFHVGPHVTVDVSIVLDGVIYQMRSFSAQVKARP